MSGDQSSIGVEAGDYWPDDTDEAEGVVVNWFASEGREVKEDESICEIQVEKVSIDIPAPVAGTISEIECEEDDEITPDDTLAWIDPA